MLSALASLDEIRRTLGERPAVFLDYDGTLTPIVTRPWDATIGAEERRVLRHLSHRAQVAIISGRDLVDLRSMVGVEGLTYSGSHGWEAEGPAVGHFEHDRASDLLPELDRAEEVLGRELRGLAGVHVERKRFAIAVHTRSAPDDETRLAAAKLVHAAADEMEALRVTRGKEIFELRPDIVWDKGKALRFLLESLSDDRVPLYIGDDETDEDAFGEVRRLRGVGILVAEAGVTAMTAASYQLTDPTETISFLRRLTETLG